MTPNIQAAEDMGRQAYAEGRRCVPAHDDNFMATLAGRKLGDPHTLPELKAWVSGWTKANVSATPRAEFF